MKAWVIHKYGDNSQVKLADLVDPTAGDDEVLVQIRAASINPVDFKTRDGMLRLVLPHKFPLILGNDCSGVVTSVGRLAKRFKVGDEVFTRPHKESAGTLAEFIAVKESAVALKPSNLSFEEAASIPLVGLTSWQGLLSRGHMKKGDRVFIPAGSGGVGTFAIQLAKHFGAWVATTTSKKNLDLVRSLGADEVIDYTQEDFADRLTNIDIVFDTMGGEIQKKAFSILKTGGQMISIVGPPTRDFVKEVEFGLGFQLGAYVMSVPSLIRAKTKGAKYKFLFMLPNGDDLRQIANLIESGKIKPVIDRVYPFSEANFALAHVESGRSRGKVVVSMNGHNSD